MTGTDNNEKYSVLITEDQSGSREMLIKYLKTRPELELAGTANDGNEALEKLKNESFDLVLLDIRLPFLSGIEVLERLDTFPNIIFTTAFDKYAMKAFDLSAVDYLLKPISIERFNQAIDKFLVVSNKNDPISKSVNDLGLTFRERGKLYIIAYRDLIYFTSNAKNSIIHTEDRDFETHVTLKQMEKKLPSNIFCRIHNQHIVNINYISHLEPNLGGRFIAFLKDEEATSLPVGYTHAGALRERLNL